MVPTTKHVLSTGYQNRCSLDYPENEKYGGYQGILDLLVEYASLFEDVELIEILEYVFYTEPECAMDLVIHVLLTQEMPVPSSLITTCERIAADFAIEDSDAMVRLRSKFPGTGEME